jgi:hypothetical protein
MTLATPGPLDPQTRLGPLIRELEVRAKTPGIRRS